MAFVVPALEPKLVARDHFGACKIPMAIPDPGGAPGTGIVWLRGAIGPDPFGGPLIEDPRRLLHLFTLPPGMRPVEERRFTCQLSAYIMMYAEEPALLFVTRDGQAFLKMPTAGWTTDGAVYLDGISFVAERRSPPPMRARESAKKARARASR